MGSNLPDVLISIIGSKQLEGYLLALLIFVLSIFILKIFKFVVISKLRRLSAKTKAEIDDVFIEIIDDIGWPFYILLALYVALQFVQIHDAIEISVYYGLLVSITYYTVLGIENLIDYSTRKVITKRYKEKEIDESIIDTLNKILKSVLWAVAIVLILSNLGFEVSTLVAGLGIGGIAIAFAFQNILADIFASFSIYFDKPFRTGDFIIIGDDLGVVKKIGIKTTRIQTLQGEELIVSNRELTETRVHNYKRMEKRRVVFSFGVKYETPTKKLKKIPGMVSGIVDRIEIADTDRVHFHKFGDFSLVFEVVYYVGTGDYNKYMDTQQEINLGIKEEFEKEGIEMAYPTQTVYVTSIG